MGQINVTASVEVFIRIADGKASAFTSRKKQGTVGDFFFVDGQRYDIAATMRAKNIVLIDVFWKELGAISRDALLDKWLRGGLTSRIGLHNAYQYIHFLKKHE